MFVKPCFGEYETARTSNTDRSIPKLCTIISMFFPVSIPSKSNSMS